MMYIHCKEASRELQIESKHFKEQTRAVDPCDSQ